MPNPTGDRFENANAEAPAPRPSGRPRVFMANEPRAYREAIAAVTGQLRPEVEVWTVEPAALDGSISRFSPAW